MFNCRFTMRNTSTDAVCHAFGIDRLEKLLVKNAEELSDVNGDASVDSSPSGWREPFVHDEGAHVAQRGMFERLG